MNPATPAAPPADRLVRFSDLPVFRLDVLTSITHKHGELLYGRLFGLRTVECQVLGVVQAYQPLSLRRMCTEVGIDKSQGSRLVAKLLAAGWLERRDDPEDQRSFYLLLTPAGRELHARINAAAVERNQRWMAGLPEDLQRLFLDGVERQIEHARELLDEETRLAPNALPPGPTHERQVAQAQAAAREDRALLVQRESLQAIYRQLGEVLGLGEAGRDAAVGPGAQVAADGGQVPAPSAG